MISMRSLVHAYMSESIKPNIEFAILSAFLVLAVYQSAFGQTSNYDPPPSYYESAKGLIGYLLKEELHQIIRGHTPYPYTSSSADIWDILKDADRDPNNPDNVYLVYNGESVNGAQEFNFGNGWNREHVWPRSLGGFDTSDVPGKDAHNLRACNISVNAYRGNLEYDYGGEQATVGGLINTFRDYDSFEPNDAHKGDVARIIFYMAVRYEGGGTEPDLEIDDFTNGGVYTFGKLSSLLEWNRIDPVDEFERRRNARIYAYQGNRNPFIDNPEWADLVFSMNVILVPPTPFAVSADKDQIDGFISMAGQASTPKSFDVITANIPGALEITAPEGFEISLDGINYTSNLLAEAPARDDMASNYDGVWDTNSNAGTGFGPWEIYVNEDTGIARAEIGNPLESEIVGMNQQAFSLQASPEFSSAATSASRELLQPLSIGESLRFDWGVNWDANYGVKGFEIYSGANKILKVQQNGYPGQIYIYRGSSTEGMDTGLAYGVEPMRWITQQVDDRTIRISATGRTGGTNIAFTLEMNSPGAVNGFRWFAEAMNPDVRRYSYFDHPAIEPVAAGGGALTSLAVFVRQKAQEQTGMTDGVITLSSGDQTYWEIPVSGLVYTHNVADGPVIIESDGEYTITGTSYTNTVTITSGVVARIDLHDLYVQSEGTAFSVASNAQVTLTLYGSNYVSSGAGLASLHVPQGADLEIASNSTGHISAISRCGGAGIGGSWNESAGSITIMGGSVSAYTTAAAAIGGGYRGTGGTITIGGNAIVDAYADSCDDAFVSTGIGAGPLNDGGTINILGGKITAQAGTAIQSGGANGSIEISGGEVVAISTRPGNAGIGGRDGTDGGMITISGGIVFAYAGAYPGGKNDFMSGGAGIGGGNGANGGIITITGGDVFASSVEGPGGAGIGGGSLGHAGLINISGNARINSMAGSFEEWNGAGIGSGPFTDNANGQINISGGEILANGGLFGAGIGGGMSSGAGNITITGGNIYAFSEHVNAFYSYYSITGGWGVGIGAGWGGTGGVVIITGGDIKAKCTTPPDDFGQTSGPGIGGTGVTFWQTVGIPGYIDYLSISEDARVTAEGADGIPAIFGVKEFHFNDCIVMKVGTKPEDAVVASQYGNENYIEIHPPSVLRTESITNLPYLTLENRSIILAGHVIPESQYNTNVIWALVNDGGTGARIDGNILRVESEGEVTITATIMHGEGCGTNYTQEFTVYVLPEYSAPTLATGGTITTNVVYDGEWRTQVVQNVEHMLLNWPTATGRLYQVMSTTNLLENAWETNTHWIPGTGENITFTNYNINSPVRYFGLSIDVDSE